MARFLSGSVLLLLIIMTFTVRGMPGIRVPLPVVIGLDIAGTVVEDAGEWKAGDRVMVNPLRAGIGLMGEMVDGGMEEYVVVSADQLFRIPDNVSFHQAGSTSCRLWYSPS